jgi:hypothetical protein
MLFAPVRGRIGVLVMVALQAFALAALLLAARPHDSLELAENVPGRENSLVNSIVDLEAISLWQDADELDGQRDESSLTATIIDGVKVVHGFLLEPRHNRFAHLSTILRYSLIRSPPVA